MAMPLSIERIPSLQPSQPPVDLQETAAGLGAFIAGERGSALPGFTQDQEVSGGLGICGAMQATVKSWSL